ncbi:MAG: hydrogenase expression/formation protein HypE [Candidatus Omnitrophica bacterium]|nr:hydrogenase expression/formation protein HypE [Candidatus Omnitrophota bacterium]
MDMDNITLAHGSGGKLTHEMIGGIFFKYFKNEMLERAEDAAVFAIKGKRIAFTTDSFVVKPIFFPGGDIGKLAVCGTVNDLAVVGATPKYISCAFIIEEGFSFSDLEKIVKSMADWAKDAGLKIVTGDTKVVGRGEADGIFINTSGIGVFEKDVKLGAEKIKPGDKVILTGNIADHGLAVLGKRKGLEFESEIVSDVAPLNKMLLELTKKVGGVKFMRDPTRGGVATTLNEITEGRKFGILIEEKNIPVSENARAACEILGLEPLYVANEGKAIIVVSSKNEKKALSSLRKNKYGKYAVTVGTVTKNNPGKVCLLTAYGTVRIVDMLSGEQLPRIC